MRTNAGRCYTQHHPVVAVAVRYPRARTRRSIVAEMQALPVVALRCGAKPQWVGILAFGTLLDRPARLPKRLDATLVNMRFVKPLDDAAVVSLAARHCRS